MMKKGTMAVIAGVLAPVIVLGGMAFAEGTTTPNYNMMGTNGMGNMMNAMNSAQGQQMMNGCTQFMNSMGTAK